MKQQWLPSSLVPEKIATPQPHHIPHCGIHTLHPFSPCFALLGELLAVQINSPRGQSFSVLGGFGSAWQNCPYTRGSCLGHCGWLTPHPAVPNESLSMVPRGSLPWIPFPALPLGQQFCCDSCKYWHLPRTCFCAFIPCWKDLMFFFWVCLDFFFSLFFNTAFLWRAWKKENLFCKGCFFLLFFLEMLTPCADILGTFHCSFTAWHKKLKEEHYLFEAASHCTCF